MKFTEKIMKPGIMAIIRYILGNMLWGTIISLISKYIHQERGNPLIDTPAN